MTNLIWTMVGAYFLTGLLLWIKVYVKIVIMGMKFSARDDAREQKLMEVYYETKKKGVEECGSTARLASMAGLDILKVIITWPRSMQWYEEVMLSIAREQIEEANRT